LGSRGSSTVSPMRKFATAKDHGYGGIHQDLNPIMEVLETTTGLVHSESMDMDNDPRLIEGNVLNKRLKAFSSLSVVSGLLVETSTSVISMKKDINVLTFDGQLQLLGFAIMSFVLFANVIATYVGVAQVYHVYRLETAGPTGFEIACSYYLNPNIVCWRHVAIKCMLTSLPLFLVATGIRIAVNFDRVVQHIAAPSVAMAKALGLTFLAIYSAMGVLLYYIHDKHVGVFRERYELAKALETPFVGHVHSMMASRGNRPLDV